MGVLIPVRRLPDALTEPTLGIPTLREREVAQMGLRLCEAISPVQSLPFGVVAREGGSQNYEPSWQRAVMQ